MNIRYCDDEGLKFRFRASAAKFPFFTMAKAIVVERDYSEARNPKPIAGPHHAGRPETQSTHTGTHFPLPTLSFEYKVGVIKYWTIDI